MRQLGAEGGFAATVAGGPLLVAIVLSALVGLIGFLSPCVLPLVPGYLSYLAGMTGSDREPHQRRMVAGSILFVLGFTLVLIASANILFAGLRTVISAHRAVLERTAGIVTILLGVVFLGGFAFLQRDMRFRRLPSPGLLGAPLLGATFGLAWTPCLTPTFTAVIALASTEPTAGRGLILTCAYCLGLGVPFVLLASGIGWMASAVGVVRRHSLGVHRAGGVILIVIGVLLATGAWTEMMNALRAWAGTTGIGSDL